MKESYGLLRFHEWNLARTKVVKLKVCEIMDLQVWAMLAQCVLWQTLTIKIPCLIHLKQGQRRNVLIPAFRLGFHCV